MGNENIKDFTIQWMFFGLLFFCLLSFAVIFVANNNADALGSSASRFDPTSLQAELTTIDNDVDVLLNISAQNNPEVSDQGSKDSVASAYGMKGTSKGFIESSQMFMSWIFTGTAGDVIISSFIAIGAIGALYFVIKSFRTGT